jgi:amidase
MHWISGAAPPWISTSCCKMSDAWHEARTHWAALRTLVQKRIGEDGVICIPTTSDIAPRLGVESNLAGFTRPTRCLMSIASAAGLPQVTLPLAQVESCPVGLSLVGPPGSDVQLADLALRLDPKSKMTRQWV